MGIKLHIFGSMGLRMLVQKVKCYYNRLKLHINELWDLHMCYLDKILDIFIYNQNMMDLQDI